MVRPRRFKFCKNDLWMNWKSRLLGYRTKANVEKKTNNRNTRQTCNSRFDWKWRSDFGKKEDYIVDMVTDLTSPMYLMVAKSFSPTRIRVPTSKSLTSIRLFMRLQQCVQRPTMLKLRRFFCECCGLLLQSHNVMWIAPTDVRCFFEYTYICLPTQFGVRNFCVTLE